MRYLLSLALLVMPAMLPSQQSSAPTGHAIVTGVAVDSVRGGYLRGAIVSVSGTTLSAMTDSMGRFRLDSVPPGSRYLQVMHPLLDSISLTVRSPTRDLVAGQAISFILSVPSPATIVGTKCSTEDRARGNGALVGTVNDADTETPSSGASVTVEWTDYEVGRRSVARLPQRRTGSVRSDGTYRVCGIPDDLSTGAVAVRGTDSTGIVPVNFANKLAVVSFHLPGQIVASSTSPQPAVSKSDSARTPGPRGNAALTGKVVDASGSPLANARVAVEADETATATDNQGIFRLSGLRAGTRSLSVRRIGFASLDMAVDVSAVATRNITVTMARYVAILDAVRVSAIRDIGLQRVGYLDRERTGAGKFFGPTEIDRRNPQRLSTLLEVAPALRMGTNANGKRYVTGRHNGCVGYFVDGFRWFSTNPADIEMSPDGFISGAEIGAVEVYDELSAPAEYQRISNRGEACAVVVIWTKEKLGA